MQDFMITLLICSAAMSVPALLYMAAMPFLAKRYSEKGRYYAWLVIVIGLIIPFRPQWSISLINVELPHIPAATPISQAGQANVNAPNFFTPTALPAIDNSVISNTLSISVWQIGFAIWLIGVIVFLFYHGFKHYTFTKMTRRWSEPITDKHVTSLFQSIKSDIGIKRQLSLFSCSSVGSPMMIGLINPRIFLPTAELSQDELFFIFKHELVHYKRYDMLYKYLLMAATAIHWFNPVIYIMTKAVNALCETSCDAEVLRNAGIGARQYYSETIIGVVKYRSRLKTILSTNFYGGKKGMKTRISSIMDMRTKKAGACIACLILLFTLGTGVIFGSANGRYQDYSIYNGYPTPSSPTESEQPADSHVHEQPVDEYDESISLPAYDNEDYYHLSENTTPDMSEGYEVDGVSFSDSYDHIGDAETTHGAYENPWHHIAATPPSYNNHYTTQYAPPYRYNPPHNNYSPVSPTPPPDNLYDDIPSVIEQLPYGNPINDYFMRDRPIEDAYSDAIFYRVEGENLNGTAATYYGYANIIYSNYRYYEYANIFHSNYRYYEYADILHSNYP